MPKNNRHGQADIWDDQQFESVMKELAPKMRAVFSICYLLVSWIFRHRLAVMFSMITLNNGEKYS